MITLAEKSAIKRILQDPAWSIIQKMEENLIDKIQDEFIIKDNEWETIKAAIDRESRIKGIREFINDLYSKAL